MANRLLLKEGCRLEQVLFATESFEEDESEELVFDDPSISRMYLAEYMLARDRKKLVFPHEEGSC